MKLTRSPLIQLVMIFTFIGGCVFNEGTIKLNLVKNRYTTADGTLPSDIYWSSTELLIRCEDGVISELKKSLAFTNTNSGIISSSAVTIMGNESCRFNGADSLHFSDSSLNMGTDDFTVELWLYPDNLGFTSIISTASRFNGGPAGFGITTDYGLMGDFQSGAIGGATISPTAPAANQWSHIALVRIGANLTYYINGVAITTGAVNLPGLLTSPDLVIGTIAFDQNNYQFTGYMDEIRITRAARYLTDFIPSTTPFLTR